MRFQCRKCEAAITIRDNMSWSTESRERAAARKRGWSLGRDGKGLCPTHFKKREDRRFSAERARATFPDKEKV